MDDARASQSLVHACTVANLDCEIDLRPGGIFRTTMRSPEGEEFPNFGCYLEVIPNEQLIWTNALQPGYRPAQGNHLARTPWSVNKVHRHGHS
jgi:uncharacterized protein YndB with AHSA1/START domain